MTARPTNAPWGLRPLLLLSVGVGCAVGPSEATIFVVKSASDPVEPDPVEPDPLEPDPVEDPLEPPADDEPVEEPACPEGPAPVPEGAYIPLDTGLAQDLAPCAGATHATAGPRDATLVVALDDWDAPDAAEVWVEDLTGAVLAGPASLHAGDALEVDLVQSGEVLVRVVPEGPEPERSVAYGLSVGCVAGCDLGFTRHPIVLMHGMAGSDAWLGVIDYFVDVEATLDEAGFLGIAPGVDAFHSVDSRAAQWQAHLDALEADGIGRRFLLVGHSQGGLDARYLASVLGDTRVAAIVTVGTPHRGTPVADLGVGLLDGVPGLGWATDAAIDVFALFLGLGEAELTAQVTDLTTPAAEAFNAAVPDVPGVYMASWAGRTCARIDWRCRVGNDNEIADTVFDLTTLLLDELAGDNDGLVPVDSAVWGDFQGVLPADHIDQVGLTDPLTTAPLDHRAFYVDEAWRLAERGL